MILELKTENKTYTTDSIDISFGTMEDIINVLDFENLNDTKQIGVAVLKASKQIKPFLKELFPDVSDEELRTVKTSNIIGIFKRIYKFATEEISNLNNAAKN